MVLMRSAWVLAMLAVTVLALLPVEHLQSPVFDGWDKAQHALAFWVLTGWALLLWPNAAMRVVVGMLAYGASPNMSEPIPMRKPLTGEPCAGEPHARFGGRGGRESFSTPIRNWGAG